MNHVAMKLTPAEAEALELVVAATLTPQRDAFWRKVFRAAELKPGAAYRAANKLQDALREHKNGSRNLEPGTRNRKPGRANA